MNNLDPVQLFHDQGVKKKWGISGPPAPGFCVCVFCSLSFVGFLCFFSLLIDLFEIESNSARQRNARFVLKGKCSGYLYSSTPRWQQQGKTQCYSCLPTLPVLPHHTKPRMGSSVHNKMGSHQSRFSEAGNVTPGVWRETARRTSPWTTV